MRWLRKKRVIITNESKVCGNCNKYLDYLVCNENYYAPCVYMWDLSSVKYSKPGCVLFDNKHGRVPLLSVSE